MTTAEATAAYQADFNAWRERVDRKVIARCGLSLDDLPDVCLADWFDDGLSPALAAQMALDESGF